MSRIRYGVSPWTVDQKAPRKFPTAVTATSADVVVVGGGLTGVLTAWQLKAAGRDVVLLEAERLGDGHSRSASGLTGLLTTADFRALEAMHGRRLARTLMETVRDAGPALAAGLKKAKIAAPADSRDILSLADHTPRGWDRDAVARTAAGLEAQALTGAAFTKATPAEVAGAVRFPGGGLTAPSKVLTGAITRLAGSRAKVFERARVTRIAFTRTDATVHAGSHAVQTSRVVICTDAPGELAPTLDRHVRGVERFHVLTVPLPAAVRRAVALDRVIAADTTALLAVSLTADGRLLLSGGDMAKLKERQRAEAQVQRMGHLMYECLRRFPAIAGTAVEYVWSAPIVAAPDRFPLVGPHRQYPHQLFAFGTDNDPSLAWMASGMLVRAVLGTTTAVDQMFGFSRVQEDRS